ncbi:MAG: hypothetical protein ACRD2B_10120 [Terriglobia bacterium]
MKCLLLRPGVEAPQNDPDVAQVWVKKIRLERVQQFGKCFPGLELWRLGLDRFWEALLDGQSAEVPCSRMAALSAGRLASNTNYEFAGRGSWAKGDETVRYGIYS